MSQTTDGGAPVAPPSATEASYSDTGDRCDVAADFRRAAIHFRRPVVACTWDTWSASTSRVAPSGGHSRRRSVDKSGSRPDPCSVG